MATAPTAAQQNAHGGSGYHLVTSSTSNKLDAIETSKIAGHRLIVFGYGTAGPTGFQFVANGKILLNATKPTNDSFYFDVVVFVHPTSNEIHVLDSSPLTDTNTRQSVTKFDPLPKAIVFELQGAKVDQLQVWKLGL